MLSHADDISRFSRAQGAGAECAYEHALAELRTGRKRSHWIWFVLPQLPGLGRSAMAQRYGLHGLGEARAYLADPLLRQRLEQVIDVIHHQLQQPDQTLEHLMGATTLLNHLGRRCAWTQTQINTHQERSTGIN